MSLQCTTTNILYTKRPTVKQSDIIHLVKPLTMSTEFADVVQVGPDSELQPGDEILISSRPASFVFEVDGKELRNLDDKGVITYRRNGTLYCTGTHVLAFAPEKAQEKFTPGGILLTVSKPKLEDTLWVKVAAAGPKSGVQVNDEILVKADTNAYSLEIDGIRYRNIGSEEIICYKREYK